MTWTIEQDNILREKYGFFMTAMQLSKILPYAPSTIRHRVLFLGISSRERTAAAIKRANSHPNSVFTKEKKRLSHIGMRHSDAVKSKISLAHIGMKYSDEVKMHVSSGKKNGMTDEIREKLKLVNKGRVHSKELREKQSLIQCARYANMSPSEKEILREKYREVFKNKVRVFKKGPTDIERKVMVQLDNIGEKYIFQYFIKGFYYDFFLPGKNMIIECDGDFWHSLVWMKERDIIKNKVVDECGFHLVRILGSIIGQENFMVGDFIG
jgi:very-short-patch-repair endonuclease